MDAELLKALTPIVIVVAVVLWQAFRLSKTPRIQTVEIGTRPWWVGVIKETGQPDCVAFAPDSGHEHCQLGPDEALALADLLDSAAHHCDGKTTKERPHAV